MNKNLKFITKIFLSLLIAIICGFLLLVLVYALPSLNTQDNLKRSTETFSKEQYHHRVVTAIGDVWIDNFTDAIMLSNVGYDGDESVVSKVISVYRYSDGGHPYNFFMEKYTNVSIENQIKVQYARYWHGYLVVLKPMISLFSYGQIRVLNTVLVTLVILSTLYLLIKKRQFAFLFPYLIAILFINPISVGKCIQYSSVFYVMSLFMIIILIKRDTLAVEYEKMFFLSMFMGCITSYLDLLSYPLVVLGVPLILYLVINDFSPKKNLILTIVNSIAWFIGYICMWAGKWIISALFYGKQEFNTVFAFIKHRTSSIDGPITFTRKTVLQLNYDYTINFFFIMSFIIFTIVCIFYLAHIKKIKSLFNIDFFLFVFIAVYPVIWYSILGNHSYIHDFFTYRLVTITIFAMMCYLAKCCVKGYRLFKAEKGCIN